MIQKEKIIEFEKINNELELISEKLREKRAIFDQENEGLFNELYELQNCLSTCKTEIKDSALIEFKETNSKKLFGGLSIRQGVSLVYDSKTAFTWAKDHNMCLNLNKSEFEKIAKIQEIDFVTKEDKITVCFPKEFKYD